MIKYHKIRPVIRLWVSISIGFITIYTFLHWLIFIKGGGNIRENWLLIWGPMLLAYIPVWIWYKPAMENVRFKDSFKKYLFMLIVGFCISGPTMILQHYLIKATGKMTVIEDISKIEQFPKSKYYTIRNYHIDTAHVGFWRSYEITGRGLAKNYRMYAHLAMPILKDSNAPFKDTQSYWIGVKYSKEIGNRLSKEIKAEKFREFSRESYLDFKETNFDLTTYWAIIGNNTDKMMFVNAIKNLYPFRTPKYTVFEAQNEPFQNRNGHTIIWFGVALLIGLIYSLLPFLSKTTQPIEDQKSK